MKRVLIIILTVILVFGLVGYASFAREFKIGLLVPGSIKDGGHCQSAYEGLLEIEKEYGAKISFAETKTPAEMKENFNYYGEEGYDLVIGHGAEFGDAALEAALEYPNTNFVTFAPLTAKNLASIEIKAGDPGYLCGIIAAMVSKTGKAGLIGGMELSNVANDLHAFELGAKSVDPDFEVMYTYIGSWEDSGLAYEAALAQIASGADMLYAIADAAGLGIIKAAIDKDVWCFGDTSDKSAFAPDNMIASAVFNGGKAYVELAKRLIVEGEFKGEPQEFGLKEGVTYLVWNEKLKKQLPQEVIEAVNKAEEGIKSGEIRVPGLLERLKEKESVGN